MRNWIYIFVFFIAACQAEKKEAPLKPAFGELEQYFIDETGKLVSSGKALEKILVTNEKMEVKTLKTPDWNAEMRPFLDTFKGNKENTSAYIIDSLQIGVSKILKFTARDTSQEIRNVTVFLHEPVTDSIIINKATANSYYKSTETLVYASPGNFRIQTVHEPVIGKPMNILFVGLSEEGVQ